MPAIDTYSTTYTVSWGDIQDNYTWNVDTTSCTIISMDEYTQYFWDDVPKEKNSLKKAKNFNEEKQ